MRNHWTVAATVEFALVDDRYVLLDFAAGCYRVLNPTATAFWSLLSGEDGAEDALFRLASLLGSNVDAVERDLVSFAEHCVRLGLLVTSDETQVTVPVAQNRLASFRERLVGASVIGAWLALGTARRRTTSGEIKKICSYYQGLRCCSRQVPLQVALGRFKLAEAIAPLPKAPEDCLPRSLALYDHLLASGIRAEHKIGVKSPPFVAHAWVEACGRVLLDAPILQYTVLSRLRPAD